MRVPRPYVSTGIASITVWSKSVRRTDVVSSLAVVVFLAAVGLGLPALNRSVSGLRPLVAGVPYQVGAGVSVVPLAGARVDAGITRPGRDGGRATFFHGRVRMQVVVRPFTRSLPEATAGLREKISRTPGVHLVAEDTPVAVANGVSPDRGRYVGPGVVGRYRAAVCAGVAVELTVRGPGNEMGSLADAVDASLGSVACRRQR